MVHFHQNLRRLIQGLTTVVLLCLMLTPASAAPPINRAAVLDFDGDGKTDLAVFRPQE